MAELLVQIQPARLVGFSEELVRQLCATPTFAALVEHYGVQEGNDQGQYINVHFTADETDELWPLVREQLVRLGLQNACIVTCTGSDGWNDYRLLHHFDRAR